MSKQEINQGFTDAEAADRISRAHGGMRGVKPPDETNAAEYVETAAEGLIYDLGILTLAATEPALAVERLSNDDLLKVGIGYGVAGPLSNEQIQLDAEQVMDEMPLCVEATTTFEVVLGTGGPDRRLCFECSPGYEREHDDPRSRTTYTIRRVFYRYSWEGSAEFELIGEDREIAEAFGRRVVPELVE